MRIVLVVHEYPPIGGGGVAVKCLAAALADLGHAVAVLTVGAGREDDTDEKVRLIRLRVPPGAGDLPSVRSTLSFVRQAPGRLRALAKEFRPDVINSHFTFPAGFAVACARLPVPHVTMAVGADIHDPTRRISADNNPVIHWLVGRAIRHADALAALSGDIARRAEALFAGARPRVVHYAAEPLAPDLRTRVDLGVEENDFLIVSVCRLVRRKRLDVLLDAVAELRNRRVRVAIIGSGPLGEALKQQAAALGLGADVRFPGRVSEADKASWLKAADLFCLASEHEGLGLVYLEAMGAGLPVIASDVGGQCDILRDGMDGRLVPVGDADALAACLGGLVDDPARLGAMGSEARRRAAAFSPRETANGFVRLFEDVLAARAGGAR